MTDDIMEQILYQRRPAPLNTVPKGWQAGGRLRTRNPDIGFGFQADFSAPSIYTVEFKIGDLELVDASPGVDTKASFPVAEVVWSVEGSDVRRLIALSNGMSISGTGQGVKVSVWDDYNPLALANDIYEYEVTAQVSPGLRAVTRPPGYAIVPYSFYDSVAASAKLIPSTWFQLPGYFIAQATEWYFFPIPLDAGVTSYRITACAVGKTGAPNANLPTYGAQKLAINEGAYYAAAGGGILGPRATKTIVYNQLTIDTDWIPISPGSQGIQILNDNAAGADAVAVNITFGIDG